MNGPTGKRRAFARLYRQRQKEYGAKVHVSTWGQGRTLEETVDGAFASILAGPEPGAVVIPLLAVLTLHLAISKVAPTLLREFAGAAHN